MRLFDCNTSKHWLSLTHCMAKTEYQFFFCHHHFDEFLLNSSRLTILTGIPENKERCVSHHTEDDVAHFVGRSCTCSNGLRPKTHGDDTFFHYTTILGPCVFYCIHQNGHFLLSKHRSDTIPKHVNGHLSKRYQYMFGSQFSDPSHHVVTTMTVRH